MVGNPILKLSTIALLLLGTAKASQASEFGTAEEAKAMLNRVITALKDDKRRPLRISTTAMVASKIVTFTCFVQMLLTASSPLHRAAMG